MYKKILEKKIFCKHVFKDNSKLEWSCLWLQIVEQARPKIYKVEKNSKT